MAAKIKAFDIESWRTPYAEERKKEGRREASYNNWGGLGFSLRHWWL